MFLYTIVLDSFTKLPSRISKLKTVHLQGFWPKSVYLKCFGNQLKNRVSPRSVLLEAVYLEALLYLIREAKNQKPYLGIASGAQRYLFRGCGLVDTTTGLLAPYKFDGC